MTNSQITLNQEQVQNQDIRKIFLFAFLSLLMYVFVIYYLFITFIILLIQKSIASILRRVFFSRIRVVLHSSIAIHFQ